MASGGSAARRRAEPAIGTAAELLDSTEALVRAFESGDLAAMDRAARARDGIVKQLADHAGAELPAEARRQLERVGELDRQLLDAIEQAQTGVRQELDELQRIRARLRGLVGRPRAEARFVSRRV